MLAGLIRGEVMVFGLNWLEFVIIGITIYVLYRKLRSYLYNREF